LIFDRFVFSKIEEKVREKWGLSSSWSYVEIFIRSNSNVSISYLVPLFQYTRFLCDIEKDMEY
jgi:hypothetical protein